MLSWEAGQKQVSENLHAFGAKSSAVAGTEKYSLQVFILPQTGQILSVIRDAECRMF